MSDTKILVATHEIHGGALVKNKLVRAVLAAGKELTDEARSALGLAAGDVKALLASGALREVNARVAEGKGGGSSGDLKDALARAEAAEAQVKELTDKVAALETELTEVQGEADELQKQLDAATKPA